MDEAVGWIRAEAIPLTTVEAGAGFADLERLRGVIGGARIVSLGEATHGTREFFQLKHRLLEYCVSELGFTIFGIEANYPECLRINDYVLHGRGDPADALAGTRFWTWDTEEVLALIEWLREWNETHERKVKFYGFDMQSSAEAVLGVIDYLKRVAPDLAAASEIPLWPLCNDFAAGHFDLLSAPLRDSALACAKRLLEVFAEEHTKWAAMTSELEWQLGRLNAVVLDQAARMYLPDPSPSVVTRDVAMAENVASLLEIEGPDAKAVLWAHNGHVARNTPYFTSDKRPEPNMGNRLHELFGPEHIVVGFAFNQGSFQARDARGQLLDHNIAPAPAGSLDSVLASADIRQFLLDLRTAPTEGPVSDWLASEPISRWIGAVYRPDRADYNHHAADPREDYDLLTFVETTTAARPNRSEKRPRQLDRESALAPVNLQFAGAGEIPEGWSASGMSLPHTHTVAFADEPSPSGGRSVHIARSSAPWRWGDGFLRQNFSADGWRGKRLRFSAAARAEVNEPGAAAQLYVELLPEWPEGTFWVRPIRLAMLDQPVRSSLWKQYTVEIDIPEEAHSIALRLSLTGNGAAWFGDLSLKSE